MTAVLAARSVQRQLFQRCSCRFAQPAAHKATAKHRKWSEIDHRGGYDTKIRRPFMEVLRETNENMIPELNKLKEEVKVFWRMEGAVISPEPGDYEIPFKFDSKESIEQWVLTVDSDHNEGNSRGEFALGKNKTGIFRGYIDTSVPKDGITNYAGYANIRGPRLYRSLKRQIPYDWSRYNTVMVRFRGDGRPYHLVIKPLMNIDVLWNDQYHYPLFTRGGPYWQEVFIPITKFFLTSKGRIQNNQCNLMSVMHKIEYIGVTIADGWTGHFNLEIDYIGLYLDGSLNMEFEYEMYQTEPHKVID